MYPNHWGAPGVRQLNLLARLLVPARIRTPVVHGEKLAGLRARKKGYALRRNPLYSLAERVGFEPTVRLHVRLISSQVHSTTLPPLRKGACGPREPDMIRAGWNHDNRLRGRFYGYCGTGVTLSRGAPKRFSRGK
jgi:hypothetical protein